MLQIIPQVDLQKYNTLAIPASAAHFADIHTLEDLLEALAWNKERQLPLLVLGGGSNIVLGEHFPGLVLRIRLPGIEVVAETDEHVFVRLGAGENWHRVVCHCLDFHYWGLENLSLIPGTVGAAPMQNIGAYGVELQEVFAELQAVEIASGVVVTFDRDACRFGYRDSVFKNRLRDRYIITSVTLRLYQQPRINLSYPALRDALGEGVETPTPHQISAAVCAIRSQKLPDPEKLPNVGSFFKNPVVSADTFARLQDAYPGIVGFVIDPSQVKLAAGWLIQAAGWRGVERDGVAVHDRQALVVTNPGGKPGGDILNFAADIAMSVRQKFNLELEMEPRVYP
ncbi:UDP-N-acetylmuramate dehydrogenase [Exilibacterium tricleocarpae]|uniref:UDP-N-acetylenolpyruvoylglucosamine reductase n=1 Tax=Exilibacterium tricleocarpae TaxID=2591008 RepID=A0A545TVR5_9GAMM|nr:UDP-N-acetylmuramate dehydrogenase [Exilibacterium tricleocarpae]TQV81320.1 UDP-N-acetylmuramate dehydrogenase [Exilibacterium tricleocarpae]